MDPYNKDVPDLFRYLSRDDRSAVRRAIAIRRSVASYCLAVEEDFEKRGDVAYDAPAPDC